jgi:hypothetical protein
MTNTLTRLPYILANPLGWAGSRAEVHELGVLPAGEPSTTVRRHIGCPRRRAACRGRA